MQHFATATLGNRNFLTNRTQGRKKTNQTHNQRGHERVSSMARSDGNVITKQRSNRVYIHRYVRENRQLLLEEDRAV